MIGKPEPQIYGYAPGYLNQNMDEQIARLVKQGAYKDRSVIVVVPALSVVAAKAANSWWNLMFPPNGKVVKLFTEHMEVGHAYSTVIEQILANPDLASFNYLMCIEADNALPPDAIVKLMDQMDAHPEFSAISGLYWTKSAPDSEIYSVPQIWGDISDSVVNFRPVPPKPGELIECNGLGMGATLFRLSMFKDERLRKPWFKTVCSTTEGTGTQDLWFFADAKKYGYRCAVDCSILVSHIDMKTGFAW